MKQKKEPNNGDLWVHERWGVVQIIKPFGNPAQTHEHVCEIMALRPRQERHILRHELMAPLATRQVLTGSESILCEGCKKPIKLGQDYFCFDSPADEHGPEIKGDACSGCVNELCLSICEQQKGKVTA